MVADHYVLIRKLFRTMAIALQLGAQSVCRLFALRDFGFFGVLLPPFRRLIL